MTASVLRVSDWRVGFLDGLSIKKRLGAFEHGGTRIECATDGKAMAMVDAGPHSTMPLFGDEAKNVETMARELWDSPGTPIFFDMTLREVVRAIGEVERPKMEACPGCHGSGRRVPEHVHPGCDCEYCACEYCGGDKLLESRPEIKKRFVAGFATRFDANLMGLAVSCISGTDLDEVVRVYDLAPKTQAVLIVAKSWRVIVMGYWFDPDEEGAKEFGA